MCPPTSAAPRASIRVSTSSSDWDGDVLLNLRGAEIVVFPIGPTDEERGGKGRSMGYVAEYKIVPPWMEEEWSGWDGGFRKSLGEGKISGAGHEYSGSGLGAYRGHAPLPLPARARARVA